MNDLVSIITPAFNSEKFIAETIRSVQNQTYAHWEMIIADDGSTDNTTALVSSFSEKDKRIKLIRLTVNSGTGIARNTALNEAKGKYIAFLDSDDVWKPEKLQKQIDFLYENDLPFTFSFYDCIDETGKPLCKRIEAPLNLTYKQLFFCNYIGNLTAIYDVQKLGKIPVPEIRKRQDWMVWLTILKSIRTAKPIPESLAYYRVRNNSISSSKTSLFQYNFAVYKSFHKQNTVRSFLSMLVFLAVHFMVKPKYSKTIKA
ncbi:MAG: glycosyltransferase family 2 protein [Flavobacterium sp.]